MLPPLEFDDDDVAQYSPDFVPTPKFTESPEHLVFQRRQQIPRRREVGQDRIDADVSYAVARVLFLLDLAKPLNLPLRGIAQRRQRLV